MKNLDGLITVVTGGGSGIGKSITTQFSENGSHVVIIGRTEEKLKKTSREMSSYGLDVSYVAGDVSNNKSVKLIFSEIYKKYRGIDILINNAGFSSGKHFEIETLEEWEKEITTNLTGTFNCSKNAYPSMKEKGKGIIINIASEKGRNGTHDSSPGYAASKAAIINLTKSLALQLAKYNIRVNCIAPAAIDKTEISNNWSEKLKEKIRKNIPLKRLGLPEEIATVAYFLATDNSAFITGCTIDVNGGLSML